MKKSDTHLFQSVDCTTEFLKKIGLYLKDLNHRVHFTDKIPKSGTILFINKSQQKNRKNKQSVTLKDYSEHSILKFRDQLSCLLNQNTETKELYITIGLIIPSTDNRHLFLFLITLLNQIIFFLSSNPSVEVTFVIDKKEDDFHYKLLIDLRALLKASAYCLKDELDKNIFNHINERLDMSEYSMKYYGDFWSISFRAKQFLIHDSLGIRALAYLLKNPGKTIHSDDLVALIKDVQDQKKDKKQSSSYRNIRSNIKTVIKNIEKVEGGGELAEYLRSSFKVKGLKLPDNTVYCLLLDDKKWEIILPLKMK